MNADSIERLVPDELHPDDATGRDTLALHLERYELAARHARGRVLDCACGAGYGTRLVADRASSQVVEAVGVDIAAEAVAYAQAHYGRAGVRYVHADATKFHDDGGGVFDTVISLETIEHVPDPTSLLRALVSHLRPGGVMIASVPTTPSVDANPHHLHDFTEASFADMFAPYSLARVDELRQVQPYSPIAALRRSEQRMADLRPSLARYYLKHPRAAVARVASTLRYGFTNRYLTVVMKRGA
nr:class I SAM-dependent methyltransferase [Kofleriaceae bacterium]